jgi:hypothetical protein
LIGGASAVYIQSMYILGTRRTSSRASSGTRQTSVTFCATGWKLFGKTATNRYLVVVFAIRSKRFRTGRAYEMNAVERRRYGPQIE